MEEDGDGGGGAEGGGGVEGGGEGEAVGYVVGEVGEEVEVGGEADGGGGFFLFLCGRWRCWGGGGFAGFELSG